MHYPPVHIVKIVWQNQNSHTRKIDMIVSERRIDESILRTASTEEEEKKKRRRRGITNTKKSKPRVSL
jgi:hypothetical protein